MNKFSKLAIASAAMVLGSAASTMAAPVLTMTLDSATGTSAAQCTSGIAGGVYDGTSKCTASTATGNLVFFGTYGVFNFENATGIGDGTGPLSQAQPALWLNNLASSSTAGTLEVTLTASGYDNPLSPFPLLSTMSGTNAAGMTQTISAYFDDADTGVAGAGVHLFTENFADFGSIAANHLNELVYTGTYGLSWILTVERTSTGANASSNIAATHTQALPVPGPLALLGLGLMGIGFLRRQRA